MTAPFISTDDLGNYVGSDLTGDDLAVMAIDAACERVRGYVDRFLNYVADDDVFLDGTDTRTLLLPEFPVIGDPVVTVAGTVIDATEYVVRREAGILETTDDSNVWPLGVGNIEVVYSHGYAAVEGDVDTPGPVRMPSDLRSVALKLASGMLVSGKTGVGGVTSETIGGYKYTVDLQASGGTLESTDEVVLERYRRVGVP